MSYQPSGISNQLSAIGNQESIVISLIADG
jgi:hypothetical protein